MDDTQYDKSIVNDVVQMTGRPLTVLAVRKKLHAIMKQHQGEPQILQAIMQEFDSALDSLTPANKSLQCELVNMLAYACV